MSEPIRKIKELPIPATLNTETRVDVSGAPPMQWMEAKARALTGDGWQPQRLMSHAVDGMVWGQFENDGSLTVPPEGAGVPRLSWDTLWSVRVFGEDGEWMMWRDCDDWAARTIRETAGSSGYVVWKDAIDESWWLYGTDANPIDETFTAMTDGAQGFRHVVPLRVANGDYDANTRPLRLVTRHYLKADDTGYLRIRASRLVKLMDKGGGQ